VKSQSLTILLVYQKQDNYREDNFELSNDEILKLERLARNIDNLPIILQNKFRPVEELLPRVESSISENNLSSGLINQNKYKRVNVKQEYQEYNCSLCKHRNITDNKLCTKCGKNNEFHIKQIENSKGIESNNNNIVPSELKRNYESNSNEVNNSNQGGLSRSNIEKNINDSEKLGNDYKEKIKETNIHNQQSNIRLNS
jgi:hypothetical protein